MIISSQFLFIIHHSNHSNLNSVPFTHHLANQFHFPVCAAHIEIVIGIRFRGEPHLELYLCMPLVHLLHLSKYFHNHLFTHSVCSSSNSSTTFTTITTIRYVLQALEIFIINIGHSEVAAADKVRYFFNLYFPYSTQNSQKQKNYTGTQAVSYINLRLFGLT